MIYLSSSDAVPKGLWPTQYGIILIFSMSVQLSLVDGSAEELEDILERHGKSSGLNRFELSMVEIIRPKKHDQLIAEQIDNEC